MTVTCHNCRQMHGSLQHLLLLFHATMCTCRHLRVCWQRGRLHGARAKGSGDPGARDRAHLPPARAATSYGPAVLTPASYQ